MKRAQVFPSTYLGKDDVATPVSATIQDVRMETIKGDGGEEEKAIAHFAGDRLKPMILNNTNWMTLEEAYGDDSDFWRGKSVEVYVDPGIMFGGKRVGGVRLRIQANANGRPVPSSWWLWADAIAECGRVGISKDELVAHLKAAGKTNYVADRDTKDVQLLIDKKTADSGEAFGSEAGPEAGSDNVPF